MPWFPVVTKGFSVSATLPDESRECRNAIVHKPVPALWICTPWPPLVANIRSQSKDSFCDDCVNVRTTAHGRPFPQWLNFKTFPMWNVLFVPLSLLSLREDQVLQCTTWNPSSMESGDLYPSWRTLSKALRPERSNNSVCPSLPCKMSPFKASASPNSQGPCSCSFGAWPITTTSTHKFHLWQLQVVSFSASPSLSLCLHSATCVLRGSWWAPSKTCI